MTNENLEAIYRKIDAFPALPTVVSRVIEITGNQDSSANELMEAILPDQAMCATILKIANSAFFGLPREVATIEKAVMVLGYDEIRNIVLGKAVFNSFKQYNGKNSKSIKQFWAHSFSCGLAAKILAERIDLSPSELFIAGLIHDIGKLAILITFPNIYSHLLNTNGDNPLSSCEKEKELFIICHDEVARKILKRWLFPVSLVQAVGYHHRPAKAPGHSLLCSTVQIADIMAHLTTFANGMAEVDFKAIMLNLKPDLFDLWINLDLPCSKREVNTWLNRLRESHEKDDAILSAFSS